jgi:hypothetical protein
MKYAMFLHYTPGYYELLSENEQKDMIAEYQALAADPRARASAQLQPAETATTVRVHEGRTVLTDGPYADTQPEQVFGAYYTFEVDNLDEAIELAARVPAARLGGAVEVRPIVER